MGIPFIMAAGLMGVTIRAHQRDDGHFLAMAPALRRRRRIPAPAATHCAAACQYDAISFVNRGRRLSPGSGRSTPDAAIMSLFT